MKKIAVIAALFAALIFSSSTEANTTIGSRPLWMSKMAWAIGVCETGKGTSHPDFNHDGGAWEGFTGWFVGTWNTDKPKHKGYPYHPYDATPRQQNRVMAISMRKHRYFGCYYNGGYKSWM